MEYLIIGKIINTHGIKGELRIDPLTDDLNRFNDLESVYIGDKKEKLTVKSSRRHKNGILIMFNEFDNINQVLKYKNQYIYIDVKDRIDLPENHFFIYELIGLEVEDINGKLLGHIEDVMQGPGNDVYIINGINNKEILVPAVKEFIKEIDLKGKKIIIDPIEGMIE